MEIKPQLLLQRTLEQHGVCPETPQLDQVQDSHSKLGNERRQLRLQVSFLVEIFRPKSQIRGLSGGLQLRSQATHGNLVAHLQLGDERRQLRLQQPGKRGADGRLAGADEARQVREHLLQLAAPGLAAHRSVAAQNRHRQRRADRLPGNRSKISERRVTKQCDSDRLRQ